MGKSNLLLERRSFGATARGTILIHGFETMSGCISDSTGSSVPEHSSLLTYRHTLISHEKDFAAVFRNAQRVVLHAG